MHKRNKYYKNSPDFGKLGEKYPEFSKHLLPTRTGYTINFKDPNALRELTISLLHRDFGLDVELPLDRLIPTVPLRLNYIHWIEDLLQMLPDTVSEEIKGIDIGTGASCIYPLLGAKMNGWKYCASELDLISFRFAYENVKRNNLEENIQVRLVAADTVLADLVSADEKYDFTMCNPPFFADKSEASGNHSRTGCRPQPSSLSTASENEAVTSGGEVEFVGKMISDSLTLKSKVKWYTTMLGKKSSLALVVAKLKENNISSIVTTEFCQGRTTRWGVAWTFLSRVVLECKPQKKRKNKSLQFTFSAKSLWPNEPLDVKTTDQFVLETSERFKAMLSSLQIEILSESTKTVNDAATKFHCQSKLNTWSHQRRKRREAARKLDSRRELSQSETRAVSFDAAAQPWDEISVQTSQIVTLEETIEPGRREITMPEQPCSTRQVGIIENRISEEDPDTRNRTIENPSPSQEHTKRKEPIDQDAVEKRHKFIKSDPNFSTKEEFFIEFLLTLGLKQTERLDDEMFLQMEWLNGKDKNCLYQLFQYFQNILNKKNLVLS